MEESFGMVCAMSPVAGGEALVHQDGMKAAMVIESPHGPVEWVVEAGLADYGQTLAAMEAHADALSAGLAAERLWLVEHPPVITAGTSARAEDLRRPEAMPVVRAGRGGQYTVHAPGQRVIYVMLDLNRRGRDVRRLVGAIEQWMIAALGRCGVQAFASAIGTGIWVGPPGKEAKIGAIGIRVRRWVSFHGAAVNVTTDLSHYGAIVPCGIADRGVARLCDLRPDVPPGTLMARFDAALAAAAPGFLLAASGHQAA